MNAMIDSPSLDDQIKRAQVAKTEAETEKLRKEAAAVQVERPQWSEYVKLIGAVILGIGGGVAAYTQYEMGELRAKVAKDDLARSQAAAKIAIAERTAAEAATAAAVVKRDVAMRELKEATVAVAELKASLTQSDTELKAAKPAAAKERLAFIQFRGDLKRELINELRTALKSKAFNAPGSERVNGDYQNLVKYFRPNESADAETLSSAVQAFFEAKGCPIKMRVVAATATSSQNPPLEIWLSHTCAT
jgi:hypothetical protein